MHQHCCQLVYEYAENLTVAARLHYEAVVRLAMTYGASAEHEKLMENVKQTQERAEQMTAAFEQHVQSHQDNRNAQLCSGRIGCT
jgi:hypothetical protein